MTEYVVRFLVGGIVVSAFSMLGDVLRPKSFAALFGAVPSAPSRRSASPCTGTAPTMRLSKAGR
jgi:hypothetical protein